MENECSSAKINEIFKGNLKIVEKKPIEKTLCQAFDYHNEKFRLLVNKGKRSKATLKRLEIRKDKVVTFLRNEFRKSDLPISNVRPSFASNFEHFLETTQGLGQNISMKYTKILKQVLKMAVVKE